MSDRLEKTYKIVYKENNKDLHFTVKNYALKIHSSLWYAKRYAKKHLPEQYQNKESAIIEIYCDDFSKDEPIAELINTKAKVIWNAHPLLKDMDFWDYTGDTGY